MDQSHRLRAEREQARQRLATLRRDLAEVIAAARDTNADDEHDPEGATIAFERSQVGALISQAEEHLAEIEAALERLAAGGFGICEGCGRPIPPARLEARPTARRCVGCG
ncbi:MAG: TraR/DksA C4-type zinc finger protein [Nocardioidaceae bacterium]|nr:TraR/DksA C4-type zinc finger protein [Nocardioidaceae bacterium]